MIFASPFQELASVFRLERGLLENILHSSRPSEVHEPKKELEENFAGTGRSLQAPRQAFYTTLGKEANGVIRRMK